MGADEIHHFGVILETLLELGFLLLLLVRVVSKLMALDLVGEIVNVLLQLFQHSVGIERTLHDVIMLDEFESGAVLQDQEFIAAFVTDGEKAAEHGHGAVGYFFKFLAVNRQRGLKIWGVKPVEDVAIFTDSHGASRLIFRPPENRDLASGVGAGGQGEHDQYVGESHLFSIEGRQAPTIKQPARLSAPEWPGIQTSGG